MYDFMEVQFVFDGCKGGEGIGDVLRSLFTCLDDDEMRFFSLWSVGADCCFTAD